MSASPRPPVTITLVACAVFQAEVRALRSRHWPDLKIRFQSSMLHMHPELLAERIESVVADEAAKGHRTVLLYGDCCDRFAALEERPDVVRTRCNNCCHLLLGSAAYRRLSHEGAFFLFPEWVPRWRHIFETELGLTRENTVDLMRDMHRKLVYLDTGVVEVPTESLAECAAFCGLPCEVVSVPLESLRRAVQDALNDATLPLESA